ncbi:MAG TPA: hypothetical protein VGG61_12325 [Gemmataceae bacterium]
MQLKRYLLVLMAGLLVAGTASAVEVRGVITKIDPDKKELLIEGKGKDRGTTFTFSLADDTRILFGSKTGTAADLAAGKRVRVAYEERDGKRSNVVIHALYLQPKGAEATPATTTASASAGSGTVRLINHEDREIVVVAGGGKGKEAETTLLVPKDVKVQRGDKATDLNELKEGETLSYEADQKDGKLTAKSLRVGAADPNAKATTPAPPASAKGEKGEKAMMLLQRIMKLMDQMEKMKDK